MKGKWRPMRVVLSHRQAAPHSPQRLTCEDSWWLENGRVWRQGRLGWFEVYASYIFALQGHGRGGRGRGRPGARTACEAATTGGQNECSCGAVQTTPPLPHACYCTICRKTSGGGGFTINIMGQVHCLVLDPFLPDPARPPTTSATPCPFSPLYFPLKRKTR